MQAQCEFLTVDMFLLTVKSEWCQTWWKKKSLEFKKKTQIFNCMQHHSLHVHLQKQAKVLFNPQEVAQCMCFLLKHFHDLSPTFQDYDTYCFVS